MSLDVVEQPMSAIEKMVNMADPVDPDSTQPLIPKEEIDTIDGSRKDWETALAQADGRREGAGSDATELLASLVNLHGFPHAWGVVYLAKHVVHTLLTRDVGVRAVLQRFMDAMSREAVFNYANCPDPAGEAEVIKYATCANSFIIAILSWNQKALGLNQMVGPMLSFLSELLVSLEAIWENGATGQNLFALVFVLTRMVLFCIAGTTVGFVLDAAFLMAQPKLQEVAASFFKEIKSTFKGRSFEAELSWIPEQAGRDCASRVAKLADSSKTGLLDHLLQDQLVDVGKTTGFVAARISKSADGISEGAPHSSAFDVFLVQQHVAGLGLVYNYQDVIERYGTWHGLRKQQLSGFLTAQGKPSEVEIATLHAFFHDERSPAGCRNGDDGRCVLACEAAMYVCNNFYNEKLASDADNAWRLPFKLQWCFPSKPA